MHWKDYIVQNSSFKINKQTIAITITCHTWAFHNFQNTFLHKSDNLLKHGRLGKIHHLLLIDKGHEKTSLR